jgi:hypothetical protein
MNSAPLSERKYSRALCWAIGDFTSEITSADLSARSARSTGHSRVCSSKTVSILEPLGWREAAKDGVDLTWAARKRWEDLQPYSQQL